MNEEFREGITETLDILDHMEQSNVNKIPKSFLLFLEKNKSNTYISNLDHTKPVNEIKTKEETKNILAVIYMKYWCTPKERQNYIALLKQNENKLQEQLRAKYNPNDIFKNKNTPKDIKQLNQTQGLMVQNKDKIFSKILKKIRIFFKIK